MASREVALRHVFNGGWATDFGVQAEVSGDGGLVQIPWLLRAENVFYTLKGNPRKVGGTTKYNSTAIESGEEIRGMFEYVRVGTAGSSTRKRVVHAGTKILADDNDGTFASLFTGLEDGKTPNYNTFADLLIMASDSTVDVPKSWDQTTAQNLAGSPPNFAFSVTHVNRVWASGNAALPSRVYYSATGDPEDWSGADTGSIDVDPDDGDIVTGLYPFRGVLLVFKGPNRGSIHIISGRTTSTFVRDLLVPGVGAAWQNLIFPFGNDVGFMSPDGLVRSVRATEKFGDFEQAQLSLPIQSWLRENVNTQALRTGWAATDHSQGYVIFTLPLDGSSVPNRTIMMDFRFDPPRWADWDDFAAYSVSYMSNPTSRDRPILYFGGTDGFLRKAQQPVLSIDEATGIGAYVRTPFLNYGAPHRLKTIQHLGIGAQVRVMSTLHVELRKGDATATEIDFDLSSGGFVLGDADENEFTLDTSTLADDQYKTTWADATESGQFREISYELSNEDAGEDLDVDAIHIILEASTTPSYEN